MSLIYNFGAVGDKGELVRYWDQKVKGQEHSKTTQSNEHLARHLLAYIWSARKYFKLRTVTMTLMVQWSKLQTFPQIHFSGRGTLIDSSLSKTV